MINLINSFRFHGSSGKTTVWFATCLSIAFVVLPNVLSAQEAQVKKEKSSWKFLDVLESEEHSPQKATIYSAIIPGWGQAYNKKYWKVPIVWAALAGVGYFIYDNQSQYTLFKEYYVTLSEYPDSVLPSGYTHADLTNIYSGIQTLRKNRDLSVIILVAAWGLNVIDANVDGHFFNFDIDEDLSMRLRPASWFIDQRRQAFGLQLVLNMQ